MIHADPVLERPTCEVDGCQNLAETAGSVGSGVFKRTCRSHRGHHLGRKDRNNRTAMRKKYLKPSCADCGERDKDVLDLDHLVCIALGGTDEPSNLVTRCANCHRRKSKRDAAEVRRLKKIIKAHAGVPSETMAKITQIPLKAIRALRKELL